MNDLPDPKVQLEDIRRMSREDVMRLDERVLLRLLEQADKAAYNAGAMLDWVRGIVARKRGHTPGSNESDS
ncbi:hypothetical protein [Singulisphaera sp. PoT]|uniref:hypothetical protein n=1 Tax=Singulisphaera sp. PoT TaxID=3411797 RepID=UPI003BF54D74